MAFRNLDHFIALLEQHGELVRVNREVSPALEITEIVDRLSKNGGPAVLFTRTGTDFPLLINAFGSERRMALALGVENLDEVRKEIAGLVSQFLGPKKNLLDRFRMLPSVRKAASWMPRTLRGRGSCQEVVMDPPDLTRLPVLTCWPADGGPFITLPCVHTCDPETGRPNLGMYRMQVFGPLLTGMHWHLHKGSAKHYQRYREAGKRMPVSVTLGGDPAYIYAATAPLPEDLDEYLLAGFLRKKRVERVKCLTNDLEVPADADFVIEGYVDPGEDLIQEGPFGDHTGFYSLADYYPRFHVTCITHRKHAVYPATVVGIPPQEDAWIGKATEKIFLEPIRLGVVPELAAMHMPAEGVFHNLVIASIRSRYEGQAVKVMNALWGAGQMMFNKILVILDDDADPEDYPEVLRRIMYNTDPSADIHFMTGPVDILDHSSRRYGLGSKMGIDATKHHARPAGASPSGEISYDRTGMLAKFPEVEAVNDELAGQGFPVLFAGVRKRGGPPVRDFARNLQDSGCLAGIRYVVFLDPEAAGLDLRSIAWIAANNVDPQRDCFYLEASSGPTGAFYVDATRKTMAEDHFEREWPNVTVMDDGTIRNVDQKWLSLGLGPHLASPSMRYKSLIQRDGALF